MIERSIVEKAAENLRHSERWSRKDIVTVCKAAGKYEELKKAGADAQAIREITFSAADIADVFVAPRHFVRYSDRLIRAISTKTDKMVGALTETSDQFDAGDYGLFSYRKEINDSRLKQKSEEVFGAYKTAAGSFLYIESWNDDLLPGRGRRERRRGPCCHAPRREDRSGTSVRCHVPDLESTPGQIERGSDLPYGDARDERTCQEDMDRCQLSSVWKHGSTPEALCEADV